jgi:hypothetical protein
MHLDATAWIALYAAIVATLALGASLYTLWRQYRQRVDFVDLRAFRKEGCAVFHVRLANRSEHSVRIIEALLEWESTEREHGAQRNKKLCTRDVAIGIVEDLPLQVGSRDGKRFHVWADPGVLQQVSKVRVVLRTGANDKLRSGWLTVPAE